MERDAPSHLPKRTGMDTEACERLGWASRGHGTHLATWVTTGAKLVGP